MSHHLWGKDFPTRLSSPNSMISPKKSLRSWTEHGLGHRQSGFKLHPCHGSLEKDLAFLICKVEIMIPNSQSLRKIQRNKARKSFNITSGIYSFSIKIRFSLFPFPPNSYIHRVTRQLKATHNLKQSKTLLPLYPLS